MKTNKRLIALLMVLVLVVTAATGCKKEDTKPESKPASSTSSKKEDKKPAKKTDLAKEIKAKKEQNEDTVGWLQVDGTTIDDVIVKGKDNDFYHRRNFNKEEEYNGVYYADKRNDFGDGSREALPVNTVIYGHALTDNPASPNYEVKFAPLHQFRDPDWASEHPYIRFSTEKGDYTYEVISVFLANSDNLENPYNVGDMKKGEYHDLVREQLLPRSLYDYKATISDDDKFITLSTCIYVLEDGTLTNYPNTYYRYGILGRLVDDKDVKEDKKLDLKIRKDRVIDPDGPMASASAAA